MDRARRGQDTGRFLEIGAHPFAARHRAVLERKCVGRDATLCSLRRDDRERAALLGSLGRLYCLGAESIGRSFFRTHANAIKLPSYPFQAESHWRKSDSEPSVALGQVDSSSVGQSPRNCASRSGTSLLDRADLAYLADHRIGDSIVFPGAGYVEMALAVARETFGSVPCFVEHIEFQKFLLLEENTACSAQAALDPDFNAIEIYAGAHSSDDSWELHARA